jgi:histone-lysine N-methyltransferase SETMAR
VKEILRRERGLKKFSRRWVPHLLSDDEKKSRIAASRELCLQFAESRERVVLRIRQGISGQKIMITIFFTSTQLQVLEALPKGVKFNQDYFVHAVLPGSFNQKRRISRESGFSAFPVHIDNSMCHNGHKVCATFDQARIERVPHPLYSPDISPCDCWLFGMLKHQMKD